MDKLNSYNGTIDLISGLRPKNNGTFPLMQAHDVQATETQRLDEMFKNPETWLPTYNGENEGGAEGGGSGGNYVLELTGESGSLTTEEFQILNDNFPNAIIEYHEGDPMDNPPIYLHSVGDMFGLTFASLPPLPPTAIVVTPYLYYIMFSDTGSGATWQALKAPLESGGETFKTKLTTEFGADTTLNETDTAVFLTALETKNVTPISQVVFDWAADGAYNIVGVLSNSYMNFDNNTITLVYKHPIYKLTLIGSADTGTIQGACDYNEPTTSSSGLQVKQITFTDRPSLYSWLQSNSSKILQTSVTLDDVTSNATLYGVAQGTFRFSADVPFTTYISDTQYAITNQTITLAVGETAMILMQSTTTINQDKAIANASVTRTEIADDSWTTGNVVFLITYIE